MRKPIYNDEDREAADMAVLEILEWIETFETRFGTGLQRREFLQDIILKHMKPVKKWTAIIG